MHHRSPWRRAAGHLTAACGDVARILAALPLACLPARAWPRFDDWPVRRVAGLAGLLTAAAGVTGGAIGFLRFARAAAGGTTDRLIEAAMTTPAGRNPQLDALSTTNLQSLSVLALPVFVFATPMGWLAAYLALSGLLRAVSAGVDQPVGDPLLTLADTLGRRSFTGIRTARARRARERQEGPAVADRLVSGEACGFGPATVVVLASRRKPDWDAGTIVLTQDAWYRLGEPFDVEAPLGLRTAYPLTRMDTIEVVRRGVRYSLPPLTPAPALRLRRR